jgi:hypothetical protein
MRTALFRVTCAAFALFAAPAASVAASPAADVTAFSIRTELPPLTGKTFALSATYLPDDASRQNLAAEELLSANHPSHQFDWRVIAWTADDAQGVQHEIEISVAPDYLAVGTDTDFLYAPLGLPQAARVARALDFWLPTSLIVDRIYEAADHRFTPSPLPPTSEMRTPRYWLSAQRRITGLMDHDRTELLAGHKKDVVLTPRLRWQPTQVAIYGWHRAPGNPIQGLSLVHGKDYADYSHGIRAIAPTVRVDGAELRYVDVLKDPVLSALLSDEGPIDAERIFATALR